jgi:hypothetical protein
VKCFVEVAAFWFEHMRLASKIVRLLLVATLAATTFASTSSANADGQLTSANAPAEQAAACHEHEVPISHRIPSRPPKPESTSYQCCLTGHDAAMVRAHQLVQPPSVPTRMVAHIESAIGVSRLDGSQVSVAPTADPPNITPLRI